MELTLKIEDYLSEYQIRELAEEAIKESIRSKFRTEADAERYLVNTSYSYVFEMVNRLFDGALEKTLKEKVPEIINELSAFHVFRKRDVFDKDESLGWKYLQEAIEENKQLIKEKVRQMADDCSPASDEVATLVQDVIRELVDEKIFNKKNGGE